MNAKELGIYINSERIAALTPTDLPVTERLESQEITFEGLYVADEVPPETEIQLTSRRKGKAYFKCLNHAHLASIVVESEEIYEATKGMKRGTILKAKITHGD